LFILYAASAAHVLARETEQRARGDWTPNGRLTACVAVFALHPVSGVVFYLANVLRPGDTLT
jgi:hypothetical protein